MPLLDIATCQPCLQNHLGPPRAQTLTHAKLLSSKFISGDEKRLCFASKSFQFPKKTNYSFGHLETRGGKLLITAVATLEPECLVHKEDGQKNTMLGVDSSPSTTQLQSSNGDSTELDERERLRRMRISKANKGNTPWNKGRKHSAETLQRIRERTRLAMQDPKVKMKLANLGHAQRWVPSYFNLIRFLFTISIGSSILSNIDFYLGFQRMLLKLAETRKKIGVGVRMGWEKRRGKLMVQEHCYFEWQNLIAEASRRGLAGEEELEWNSYKILDEQLKQEWLESVEQRKSMPRPNGSKRAPKSPEQRKKIAEAIAAKWTDPTYRERVCSGIAKYHGIPTGAERKPRRKPSGDGQSRRRNSAKKKDIDIDISLMMEPPSRIERLRVKRGNTSLYKDPSASSKLEMIKNIRAQRAAAESKKIEAIKRARLLIAEAEKAAKALEVAAMKSPIAQASLMETRKLIAEAVQSIESIEMGQVTSNNENGGYSSVDSAEVVSEVKEEIETQKGVLSQAEHIKVNGTQPLPSKDEAFNFGSFTMPDKLNGEELLPRNSNGYSLQTLNLETLIRKPDSAKQLGHLEPNGNAKFEKNPQPNGARVHSMEEETASKPDSVTKKWVRGRLVEVTEGA
ncbi:hypothetical protein Patl1_33870 [Pistacia atlantica]|uniref:Uncharacterized protein n=1 Tax=Pistacia atlantica TaxID=434234 RepID=A0ACC0ZRZ7_9ROSI|nr:hypothetical protein Patl1_33870 [Pistacia atlantica]